MAKVKTASAGKFGADVKSDCFVKLETNKKKSSIEIKSKVSSMFGDSIKILVKDLVKYFGLKNTSVYVEDYGALPYVIAARFESAVKRLNPELQKEYLLDFNPNNKYKTNKDDLRRSRLYLPGNEPKFYPNAGLHKPDGVILDLEDSVAPTEKDSAQLLVRNALRAVDFYGAERMVRINQLPKGLEDLKYVIPHNANLILIPKVESAEQIKHVEREVEFIKEQHSIKTVVHFMPIIESAKGIENAYQIATASQYNVALAIGLEDYTADIGTQRTNEGTESFFARAAVINAAKAAGLQAIDTVFSDVSDMDGLRNSVEEAKSIGFEGKGCIHPRQIKVINSAFAPTETEIDKAKKIVYAFEEAESKGIGVVSIGSKMIDAPVVKRAQNVIKLALLNNLINKNWRKELSK